MHVSSAVWSILQRGRPMLAFMKHSISPGNPVELQFLSLAASASGIRKTGAGCSCFTWMRSVVLAAVSVAASGIQNVGDPETGAGCSCVFLDEIRRPGSRLRGRVGDPERRRSGRASPAAALRLDEICRPGGRLRGRGEDPERRGSGDRRRLQLRLPG